MTNIASIARPYAKAAFETAKESNQLPMWSLVLKQLSLIVQDNQVKLMLKNPCYTKAQLSDFIISCLHEDGFLPVENFVRLLAEKKRLSLIPAVSELFEQDSASESGYLFLVVTSAFEMDEKQQSSTKEKLQKQFNSKCEIEYLVDSSLIGGLLVRSGSWVLDGTIKGNLERLKSVLI